MKIYEYGNKNSEYILIQMVDQFDLDNIEKELSLIKNQTDKDFMLLAIKVDDWNKDLSPWFAPAIFKNDEFLGEGENTLKEILKLISDKNRKYIIGGYSLSALFAIWSSYKTDDFIAVAAASPSIWFPNFIDFMKDNKTNAQYFYLSLGDKEDKTRNETMKNVSKNILDAVDLLNKQKKTICFEWNEGNHFKEPEVRTAKAFSWILNKL